MYGYIYKITNLTNGKIYIGQHLGSEADHKYFGSGKLLKDAIKKYGKANFKKEILEFCKSEEDLNVRERYWISKLNATDLSIGYNISDGGQDGCFRNKQHTELECQKISLSSKDRIWINNGTTNKFIKSDMLSDFLNAGWQLGRLIKNSFENLSNLQMQNISKKISEAKKGKFYFYNDTTSDCKMISRDQIDYFIQLGYHYGTNKIENYSNPTIYINNGTESLKCHYSEVGSFLKRSEWVIGKISNRKNKKEQRPKPGYHPHTEETKQKIKDARARQAHLVLDSNRGKKWYNNGEVSKMFFDNNVPDGFTAGRLLSKNARQKIKDATTRSNLKRKGNLQKITVIKDGIKKVIGKSNLNNYLKQGYTIYIKDIQNNEK